MPVRKVCVVITTRGNHAKMKSTIRAIAAHEDLEAQVVIGGGVLFDSFGDYGKYIETDGFLVSDRVNFLMAGDSLESMGFSAGTATSLLSSCFERLRPDIVLVIADRYEALSVAHAATCMNIAIAHLEGGEISGSIDERIRHAITKLAHIHFPACADAALRVERLGESRDNIFEVGTPSLDLLQDLDFDQLHPLEQFLEQNATGDALDLSDAFLVVSQHPVVLENNDSEFQALTTLRALEEIGLPVVWILPNMDAGGGAARHVLERETPSIPISIIPSLPMELYAILLCLSKCLVGNSSSGIRECAYLGVPAVNIGTRQDGRQRGRNVIDVLYESQAIAAAIEKQISHGRYPRDDVYGDGRSGTRIAEVLASHSVCLDKRMTY